MVERLEHWGLWLIFLVEYTSCFSCSKRHFQIGCFLIFSLSHRLALSWESPIFNRVQRSYSHGCFQFHGGCPTADARVGPLVIGSLEPFSGLFVRLLNSFKDGLAQPLNPNWAVAALDVGVLLRLATPRCI